MRLYFLLLITLFLVGCSTIVTNRQTGTARPAYNILSLNKVDYILKTDKSTYSEDDARIILKFVISNTHGGKASYKLGDKFLSIYLRDKQRKLKQKIIIKKSQLFPSNPKILGIPAGKEKEFEIPLVLEKSIVENYDELFCQLKLDFLGKGFSFSKLSIMLNKE